jgi:hypothetical protein
MKYVFMFWHRTTAEPENVVEFKYLKAMVTNQNYIHEKIKSRLKSESSCYHAVHVFCLLSKDVRIKIYITIILLVVFYGCETWSVMLKGEHR